VGDDQTRDRELGLDRPITRRDFLNGVAMGAGAVAGLGVPDVLRARLAQGDSDYPPGLTGLRGSHDGAFEMAHRLRDGVRLEDFGRVRESAEHYDLIIVGAGISGLAAAYFYRQQAGRNARILLLDNHDDFGGHARRNEFTVGATTLIGYGGTQSIDTPSAYSGTAKKLLRELGVDLPAFHAHYDRQYFRSRGLSRGVFFDRETFGSDRLVAHPRGMPEKEFLAKTPLAPTVQADLVRLYRDTKDYLAGQTVEQKLETLAAISYRDYLTKYVKVSTGALQYLQPMTHGYYGVGIDAVPAGDCRGLGYPGFEGLGLGARIGPGQGLTAALARNEPYIFHFPDGNATIARLLVRQLVPGVLSGDTMRDVVTARARYDRLDVAGNRVRLRLRSTVLRVAHAAGSGDPDRSRTVEVVYVRDGARSRVTAGQCILACWHGVIPHICPELPAEQKRALAYGVKVPLVYTNVALRDWKALAALGVHGLDAPGSYWSEVAIDFPVSMGRYRFARGPEDPVVLHLMRAPCKPGLPAREQHRHGRTELLGTVFDVYERRIRDQLARMFGSGGFDPARDIAGITVNRWSHGYTYEYNSLWDPRWPPGRQPCEIARQRRGNVAIANADAAAYAYTDAAIDQAARAVAELTSSRAS
jgi:spermidine dehydrogenase